MPWHHSQRPQTLTPSVAQRRSYKFFKSAPVAARRERAACCDVPTAAASSRAAATRPLRRPRQPEDDTGAPVAQTEPGAYRRLGRYGQRAAGSRTNPSRPSRPPHLQRRRTGTPTDEEGAQRGRSDGGSTGTGNDGGSGGRIDGRTGGGGDDGDGDGGGNYSGDAEDIDMEAATEYADDTAIDRTDEAHLSRLRGFPSWALADAARLPILGPRQRREQRWDVTPAVRWRAAQLGCGWAWGLAAGQRR